MHVEIITLHTCEKDVLIFSFYRPQTKLGQGNIFTPVCHSVHKGEASDSVHAGIPPPLPPGSRACWEIRSTSGRYASYWNAILFRYVVANPCLVLFDLKECKQLSSSLYIGQG